MTIHVNMIPLLPHLRHIIFVSISSFHRTWKVGIIDYYSFVYVSRAIFLFGLSDNLQRYIYKYRLQSTSSINIVAVNTCL